jgi:hypothetical protein
MRRFGEGRNIEGGRVPPFSFGERGGQRFVERKNEASVAI